MKSCYISLLILLLSCNGRLLSIQDYDRLERAAACDAERTGKKWIVLPGAGADDLVTMRRVVAGEEFDVITPKDSFHVKSGHSGWRIFSVTGSLQWKGEHPDLVFSGSVLFMVDYVDTVEPCGN